MNVPHLTENGQADRADKAKIYKILHNSTRVSSHKESHVIQVLATDLTTDMTSLLAVSSGGARLLP